MEPIAWIAIVFAITLGFFMHAVVGFAAALTSLPILLLVLEVPQAVAVLAILFTFSSAILLWQSWKEARWKLVVQLAIGITVGTFLGVWTLTHAQPLILKKVLGAFTLLYVGYTFVAHHDIELFKHLGMLFGVIGGFFSGLFAAGGAPNVIFVNNAVHDAIKARATIIAALAVASLVRLPLLWREGLLTQDIWIIAAVAFPFFLAAILVGQRISHKLPKEKLHKALLLLLTVAGINLLF